jgi:hypothetical protein
MIRRAAMVEAVLACVRINRHAADGIENLFVIRAGMMMVMAMIVVVIAMRMRTVIMHLAAAATARSGGDVFRCGRCPGRAATAARGVRLFRRAHFQSPTLLHHIPYGGI